MRMLLPLAAASLLGTASALLAAASPAPPSPAPSASPRADEEVPEGYRKLLATLRSRHEEDLPANDLLFGRAEAPDFSNLRVREIKPGAHGMGLFLEDDPKEYHVNDIVQGRRLVALAPDEATFEHRGEQRRVKIKRAAPTLQVRAIKPVEGELAAFMEGERRPLYPGDLVRGARIVKVEADGVTFQIGAEVKKIGPKPVKKPFPALAFNGIIEMASGRVVLLKGRPEPVKVGDVVDGAKILEVTPTAIAVEYEGERRSFPPR